MGKKLVRIPFDQLKKSSNLLTGQLLNVITWEGAVAQGYFISLNNEEIIIENKRQQKMKYTLETISEVIFDKPAER